MLNIWESVSNVFVEFGSNWGMYAAELVAFFLLFYFVFRILKEGNERHLIAAYSLLVLFTGILFLFSQNFDNQTYFIFLMVLSLFFLLLFNTELKRVIRMGKSQPLDKETPLSRGASAARAEECIAAIMRAVQNLSKNNTGALIILSNGNLPKEILDSGVKLGAMISSQLIEGIFINKAPLHDGAMIVHSDRIEAAGCFLPLTQKDLPKDYGTRHRAGIGVTEVSDVMTIIVSEETGIVSTVRHGEITRYIDTEALNKFLRAYYWKELNREGKKA